MLTTFMGLSEGHTARAMAGERREGETVHTVSRDSE